MFWYYIHQHLAILFLSAVHEEEAVMVHEVESSAEMVQVEGELLVEDIGINGISKMMGKKSQASWVFMFKKMGNSELKSRLHYFESCIGESFKIHKKEDSQIHNGANKLKLQVVK